MRYHTPKTAQHAVFGRMSDYNSETQSLAETDQSVGAQARAGLRTIRTEVFDGHSLILTVAPRRRPIWSIR